MALPDSLAPRSFDVPPLGARVYVGVTAYTDRDGNREFVSISYDKPPHRATVQVMGAWDRTPPRIPARPYVRVWDVALGPRRERRVLFEEGGRFFVRDPSCPPPIG